MSDLSPENKSEKTVVSPATPPPVPPVIVPEPQKKSEPPKEKPVPEASPLAREIFQKTGLITPPPVLAPPLLEKSPVPPPAPDPAPVAAPTAAEAAAKPHKDAMPTKSTPGFFQRLFGGGKQKSVPKQKSAPPDIAYHRTPPRKIPATPPVKHQAELPLPGLEALTPVPPLEKTPAPASETGSAKTSPAGQKTKPPVQPRVMAEKRVLPGTLTVSKIEADQPRRRIEATPEPPVVSSSEPKEEATKEIPTKKKRLRLSSFLTTKTVFSLILVLVVALGAYFIWQALLETRLMVKIDPGDAKLDPQALFVLDFDPRVKMIRRDLEERRRPLLEALEDAKNSYNAADNDYKAREQTKQFLVDSITKARAEVPAMLQQTNDTLTAMWNKDYAELDSEYAHEQDAFTERLVQRAKELKIDFQVNPTIKAPEVSANAFRLALYGAPKSIDVTKERQWVEDQLKGWKMKEDEWSKRRIEIRDRSTKIRKPLGGKVDEVNLRIAQMEDELKKSEDDIAMVKAEVETFQERVAEQEEKLKETFPPAYADLLRVPEEFLQSRVTVGLNGSIDLRELDVQHDFPPGKYRLLLRATKNGEQLWALKEIEIKQYKRNSYEVTPSDFKPAKSLIE